MSVPWPFSFSRCSAETGTDCTVLIVGLILVLLDLMMVYWEACLQRDQVHTWWKKRQLCVETSGLILQREPEVPGFKGVVWSFQFAIMVFQWQGGTCSSVFLVKLLQWGLWRLSMLWLFAVLVGKHLLVLRMHLPTCLWHSHIPERLEEEKLRSPYLSLSSSPAILHFLNLWEIWSIWGKETLASLTTDLQECMVLAQPLFPRVSSAPPRGTRVPAAASWGGKELGCGWRW